MKSDFLNSIEPLGKSAPEAIFQRLSDAIATGELRQGDRLPSEASLAASLGVAVMTLRRALEPMRQLGLIEARRGRNGGNFVSNRAGEHFARLARELHFSRQEARDLTDWRRAISGEASYLAAERASAAQLKEMALASLQFDQNIFDAQEARIADGNFHLKVSEASGSARLHNEEAQIQVELSKLLLHGPFKGTARATVTGAHTPLLKAILARDGDLGRRELIVHVEETFSWIAPLLAAK